MRLLSRASWGIVIYALLFLTWSGFVLHGFVEGILPRIAGLLVLMAVALIAGHSLRFHTWRDIIPYSMVWTITVGLLDIVYSVPFAGWSLFSDWNVWVGYSLVLLVPLFAPLLRHSPRTPLEEHAS